MRETFRYAKHADQLLFQLDFQKVGWQTRGKWLIRGTKHHKDSQLLSLGLHV